MTAGTMTRYRNATPNEQAMREHAAQLKQERAKDDDMLSAYVTLDIYNEQFNHWYLGRKAA